ncbi:MAG: rod shape-determining protein MreC [Pseudomonadota bacterium]
MALATLSCLLITIESSTRMLEPMRGALSTLVSPIYLIAESPYLLSNSLGDLASSHSQLRDENQALRRKILELSQISQQYVTLKAENDRLRGLLGSQGRLPYEVLIAELVGVVPNPNTLQIIIDKGTDAGVHIGQAVLDAQGLFGQVVEIGQYTSRVLLVSDADHAVPVQINRNGVRSIAGGTGEVDRLELENIPVSADIVEGDLVETSGLGGRFPAGYPVGVVHSVVVEPTSTYAEVLVRPSALLDRSRHVLVIFKPSGPVDTAEVNSQ